LSYNCIAQQLLVPGILPGTRASNLRLELKSTALPGRVARGITKITKLIYKLTIIEE